MTNDEPPDLPIHGMAQRHPGLSEAAAAYLVEAADATMQASHRNELDATRDGAYACVIAAVVLFSARRIQLAKVDAS